LSTKRYLISGRVQGVGFRWSVRSRADALGISGFVRNLPDGRVEVVADAPDNLLTDFEEYLKTGPPGARVDSFVTETMNTSAVSIKKGSFEITFY